ncbi:MAG: T9SS type A sorting domain-containing protein [Flavobacteriaceae bacterium]|nr:T9SS type A sorting domain-containing protein [Flavobacteriaceae bacterium]
MFSVYPNPTTSELFIVSEQELTATIFDMSGKQIETVLMYQNNQYSIDVRFLSKGAYWLQLKTGEKVKQIKFLKK